MTYIIGSDKKENLSREQLLYDPKVRAGWSIGSSIQAIKQRNMTWKIGVAHFDNESLETGDCVFFSLARTKCDLLLVMMPSDISLREQKKKFKFDLAERAFMVASLSVVDYIVPYDEPTPQLILTAISPDIVYHGRVAQEDISWTSLSRMEKVEIEHPFQERKLVSAQFNGKYFKL